MADLAIVPSVGDTLAVGTEAKPISAVRCSGPAQSQQVLRREVAGAPLSGGRVVRADSASQLQYADSGTPAHATAIIGVTRTAIASGDGGDVVESGFLDDPAWAWTAGGAIFCGAAGVLTQTAPAAGFVCIVGYAVTTTRLYVAVRPAIVLA